VDCKLYLGWFSLWNDGSDLFPAILPALSTKERKTMKEFVGAVLAVGGLGAIIGAANESIGLGYFALTAILGITAMLVGIKMIDGWTNK